MALFNYNDLLNESTVSTEAYDSLFKNSFLKSADYVQVNEYDKFDIFLSHSYSDRNIIPKLKSKLELLGYSVYVDWINDKLLSRENVTSKSLFYATSENTQNSKWMPWELGYFDGLKNKRVAILPLKTDTNGFGEDFKGQEYLGLYYWVDIVTAKNSTRKTLFINARSNKYSNYDKWVTGEEPYSR